MGASSGTIGRCSFDDSLHCLISCRCRCLITRPVKSKLPANCLSFAWNIYNCTLIVASVPRKSFKFSIYPSSFTTCHAWLLQQRRDKTGREKVQDSQTLDSLAIQFIHPLQECEIEEQTAEFLTRNNGQLKYILSYMVNVRFHWNP